MADRPIPDALAAGDLVYRTPPAVEFVRGSGMRLYDSEGREYIDAEAANGTLSWGYDPEILREACRRAEALPVLPSFCESRLRLRVIQRLADRFQAATGCRGRVAIDLGGAQAMEMAMRIVAANRGAGPVLTFQGGYHGRTPFTAHLSASSRYRAVQPWPGPEVIRLPYPDCSACPHRLTSSECNPACAQAIERMGNDDLLGVPAVNQEPGVSALVLEPLLNVGGCALPDSGHLRRVVSHVRSLGGLIVADEIFTGLHRIGPEWGFQLHGIVPDIIVASKALTNGITAFSCVWAREPLAHPDVFPPGSHSSTYAGNQHSLAIVDTVLDRWEQWPGASAAVSHLSSLLSKALEDVKRHSIVRSVQVVGAVARVELTGPYAGSVREIAGRAGTVPGLLVASTGMAPTIIALHPSLVCAEADVSLIGQLLDRAVEQVEGEVG